MKGSVHDANLEAEAWNLDRRQLSKRVLDAEIRAGVGPRVSLSCWLQLLRHAKKLRQMTIKGRTRANGVINKFQSGSASFLSLSHLHTLQLSDGDGGEGSHEALLTMRQAGRYFHWCVSGTFRLLSSAAELIPTFARAEASTDYVKPEECWSRQSVVVS